MRKLMMIIFSIFHIGFSQDDSNLTSKLGECAELKSDLARLVCYDELAKNFNSSEEDSNDKNWDETYGWIVNEEINPIDDTKTFYAILRSESGKSTWGKPITLFLRYQSGKSQVFINWDDYLGSEAMVLMRIGSEKAFTSKWSMSTDSKATFYPKNNIEFISKLKAAEKAVFKVTPYGDSPIIAIFDLRGLSDVIGKYDYTGW
jgi:type VI secretion system protein VasI